MPQIPPFGKCAFLATWYHTVSPSKVEERQVFVVVKHRNDGKYDLYGMDPSEVSPQDRTAAENCNRIRFPQKHTHVVWDPQVSDIKAIFDRLDPNLTGKAKHLDGIAQRNGTFRAISLEIGIYQKNTIRRPEEAEEILGRCRDWEDKIAEAQQNFEANKHKRPEDVSNWIQIITPSQAYELRQLLKALKDKVYTYRKAESEKSFRALQEKINGGRRNVETGNDFRAIREQLKGLQAEVKATWLDRDARQKLFDQLNAQFQILEKRQDAQNQKRDAEFEKNYRELRDAINAIKSPVQFGSDLRATNDQLRQIREQLKNASLNREKRDQLWNDLNVLSDVLKKRMDQDRKQREGQSYNNYVNLKQKLDAIQSAVMYGSDHRDTRQKMKDIKDLLLKIQPLQREQKDELFKRLNSYFDTLNQRADQARREFEAKANSNFYELKRQLDALASTATYSTDFKGTGQQLKQFRSQLMSTQPLQREQKNELFQRLNQIQDSFRVRSDQDRLQKQQEWERRQQEFKQRLQENIYRTEESISRMEESISHDYQTVNRFETQYYNVRPGNKADEIRRSLSSKIESIREKIRSKESKISSMRTKVDDMRRKLYN